MKYFYLQYNIPGLGWSDEDELYDMDEVKEAIQELRDDYGKDTQFKLYEITRTKVSLKGI